ncbi:MULTISPECIES: glycosyltransferase family 4 protein [Spirulina sp. CCY15215]|uniref:glycosyltransferase family 4 protein n=1 Tax=Spirulina sp. CCY15215 TaxID=2767591 RepID=UPI001950E90E
MRSKKKVLYIFRRKRKERLELYEKGEGPDEMLYGLTHLDSQRFRASFIEDDENQWSWWHRLFYPIELEIVRKIKVGFALHLALENLARLKTVDIIITTVDTCGLPIAMLKYFGIVKTPVIYISQGLSDRLEWLPSNSWTHHFFQTIYSKFLRAVDRILVLGEGAITPLSKTLAIPIGKISCLPFGIDQDFWQPSDGSNTEQYILSVGSDIARDYQTLLEAITDQSLKIVTRLPIQHPYLNINTEEQIEIGSEFSDLELRKLYQKAHFVVTPLQDVAQPSGQSATLQAMACGKAVILTKTIGLWDSKTMKHLENCYLVEPNNIESLLEGICYFWKRPEEVQRIGRNARTTVEQFYSSSIFARKLEIMIENILDRHLN